MWGYPGRKICIEIFNMPHLLKYIIFAKMRNFGEISMSCLFSMHFITFFENFYPYHWTFEVGIGSKASGEYTSFLEKLIKMTEKSPTVLPVSPKNIRFPSNMCFIHFSRMLSSKMKSIRYSRKSAGVDPSQKFFCQMSIFIHFSRNRSFSIKVW
jgi:hypothetical protein